MGQSSIEEIIQDIEEFGERRPKLFKRLTLGAALGIAGLICSLAYYYSDLRRDFERKLVNLDGVVAYTVGTEIHLVNAEDAWKQDAQTERVQCEGNPSRVLIIDENTLAYSTKRSSYEPTSRSKVSSDCLYVFDFKSGLNKQVFDPYSEDAKRFFGDVKGKDKVKKEEIDEFLYKKREGIKIVYGDRSAVQINDLGFDELRNQIYARINNSWFRMNRDGSDLSLASVIPGTLRKINVKSPDGSLRLEDPMFGPLILTDGKYLGYNLEEGSNNPDWYPWR